MRAINLLPRDEPRRSFEAGRGVAFGAAGGFALVSVALAALLLAAGGSLQEEQARLDALNAELATLPEPGQEEPDGNAELAAAKNRRIGALSSALSGRVAWDSVLRELSLVLSGDVWLTSLASQAPGDPASDPAAAATGAGLVLNGATYSQSGVARLLARLSVVPTLSNVRLQSSDSEPVGTRKIVRFTILADVKPGGSS